jgi:hypothetical protein
MFDGVPDTRSERARIVKAIKDNHIKIVHHCCCCHKRLETFWDSHNELDGRWMALEVDASEIFHSWVADPDRVLCNWCFGSGEWKKRGIRWK